MKEVSSKYWSFRHILLCCFMILSSNISFGQSKNKTNDSNVLLGLRLGTNFADVNIPGYNGVQNLISPPRTNVGLIFGGILNLKFSEKLSLQNELTYIQKGFSAEDAAFDQILGQDFDFDLGLAAKTTINYLELAPVIKYTFNDQKVFRPYLSAGPYIGYALSGNIRSDLNIIIANIGISRTDLNLQDDIYNRLDFGLMGGFGLQANFGSGFAFTDFQFAYSIPSAIQNETVNVEMSHMGLRWGVGVAFYM